VRTEESSLKVKKEALQYVLSDPLPFAFENNTLEAWIEIDAQEAVKDLAIGRPVQADTNWEEDYFSAYAVDGNRATYWSSQLGTVGRLDLKAMWWMQLPGPVSSVDGAYIRWFQPAEDFQFQISMDNHSWQEILKVQGNTETTTYIRLFFQAVFVRLIMTRASEIRMSDPGKDRPVYSIYEFETLTDMVLSRLKPTVLSYVWDLPPQLARDGDSSTYWSTKPGDRNASLYFDFGSLQKSISVVAVKWRFKPFKFTLYISEKPCGQGGKFKTLQIFAGAGVQPVIFDTTLWNGQCLWLEIDQVMQIWGNYMAGLYEVEVYRESTNLARTAKVIQTEPAELFDEKQNPTTFISPVSMAMDGDPSTSWLIAPTTPGRASLTLDLGKAHLLISIRVLWGTVKGYGYFASDFAVSAGLTLDRLEQVDVVTGNFINKRRFVLFKRVRFVKLIVFGIMFSNPLKRVALEDLLILAASDNMALENSTKVDSSTQWAACAECNSTVDGAYRIHGSQQAVDGDLSTWWGLPLGITRKATDLVSWQVVFDIPMVINIVVVRWRYPAESLSVWCAFNVSTRFAPAGFIVENKEYLTPIVFSAPRTCRVVQLTISVPVETFAGEGIVGLQEVEVYSTAENLALNAPVVSTDGQDASVTSDASDQTKLVMQGEFPINLTFDLGKNISGWAVRSLWSSGTPARGFEITTSLDNINWKTLKVYEDNMLRDLYTVEFFTARYVKVMLITTQEGSWTWSLRTLAVYGSPNYAKTKPTLASRSWNHTGTEACDGINTTFWVAEPLATSAVVRVDLQQDFFVGDGVRILWKFPAEDFQVMYSLNATLWDELYSVTGNLDNYTEIQTNFVGRFVEIRMTRPSLLNGDGSYAIYSFDVVFDPNLAHGKVSTASHTMLPSVFGANNAIDQKPLTTWMPPQNTDTSEIIFDLLGDAIISQFSATWRHPPKAYDLMGQDVVTLEYFIVIRFRALAHIRSLTYTQNFREGFVARRVKIRIMEVSDGGEGKVCSLRDVLLHTFENKNIAKNTPVTFSNEIRGNPARFANDGNQRGTYWMPGEKLRSAWLVLDIAPFKNQVTIARTSIWWRFPPGSFAVQFYHDTTEGWATVYRSFNQTTLFTDFYKYRTLARMKLIIFDVSSDPRFDHDIGLFDISLYPARAFVPPAVYGEKRVWDAVVQNVNDIDISTYWMAPAWTNKVEIRIDLGKIYNVYDVYVWFGLLSQGFKLFVSTTNFGEVETLKKMTSTDVWGRMRLEIRGVAFQARYVRIDIFKSYEDPEYRMGTTIRDIAIYQFRNLAEGRPTSSDIVWNYPAAWATDTSPNTYWMSRFNAISATLVIDLGVAKNVGGITGKFKHICSYFRIEYSLDNSTWKTAFRMGNNVKLEIYVDPNKYHFEGRYVRIHMAQPKVPIFHPDKPGDFKSKGYVFGLSHIQIFEHTGGGGALGIQNLDGSEFNSIVWGQRQPGEWMLGSEKDVFTENVNGGAFKQDEGNAAHIVVTFRKVRSKTPHMRKTEIAFYRNGLPYGKAYSKEVPEGRLAYANQTRMVFGVRSSIFANKSFDFSKINGVHSLTHSPYFWGKIYNVTLIQNALDPEEVQGLYNVVRGGEELGCHCYDACPFGYNRFNRSIPVPCSGQGVCKRNQFGVPVGPGRCACLPGYSGDNCQSHCSELSSWGCCEIDDDCPKGTVCDRKTKACNADKSVSSSAPFRYAW